MAAGNYKHAHVLFFDCEHTKRHNMSRFKLLLIVANNGFLVKLDI